MALQKSGVQLTAEGANDFIRLMRASEAATTSFVSEAVRAGTKVSAAGQVIVGAFREMGAMGVRAMTDLGRAAIGMAVDFGGKSFDAAMDFQDSMNLLQATSEATDDQIAQLGKRARELGADLSLPATSAADAGEAMLELSKAGLSVDRVMGAAKGTLQLAAAANIDEARAAEIAANALNAFKLSGDKAVFVADLLANAANKSSIDIEDAADSFKMASTVFSAFQSPVVGAEQAMTDLTASIALLGNAGIKGSDAGTSLKQMLLQLTGPSQIAKEKMQALALAAMSTNASMEDLTLIGFGNAKERSEGLSNILKTTGLDLAKTGDIAFDASGKMRPLKDIINLVTLGTKNMTDEQRANYLTSIFGADATRAVIALMQAGPAAFDQMTAAVTRQGGAAELAAARTKGLRGAWDGLKSVLETVGMTLAQPFLEPLERGIRRVAEEVQKFPIDRWATNTMHAIDQLSQGIQGNVPIFHTFADVLRDKMTNAGRAVITAIVDAIPGVLQSGQELGAAALRWADEVRPDLEQRAMHLMRVATDWIKESAPIALTRFLEYRNALVGFVLENTPTLIDALHEWSLALLRWIEQAAPGMLRTFGEKTGDLVRTIGEHAPIILAALGDWALALAQWVVDAAPELLRNLGSAAGSLVDEIGRQLPGIVDALAAWGAKLVAWVIDAAPGLFAELLKLNTEFIKWIAERVPGIAAQLGDWALRFVEWLGPVSGKLLIAAGEMFGQFLQWIVGQTPAITAKLGDWASAFGMWVWEKAIPNIVGALGALGGTLVSWITDKASDIAKDGSVGRALIDGMKNGVAGAINGFSSWLTDQWSWLMSNIKGFFGISSPSTLMADQVGVPLIEGLKQGMGNMFRDLWEFSYEFFDDAVIKRFWELANGAWTIGKGLVDGIKQGIQDYWGGFLDDMRYLVDQLPEGIRKILGISSPSKLAIETIGKPFAEGIEVGFMQQLASMEQSMIGSVAALASPQMVQPIMSAAYAASAPSNVTTTNENNYYYSPTYGTAPKSPVQDFAVMRAFAL